MPAAPASGQPLHELVPGPSVPAARSPRVRLPGSSGGVIAVMDRSELLERYEATGEERWFHAAVPLFERALAEEPDAVVLRDYGYLLQGYARATLRRAVELYERGIAL